MKIALGQLREEFNSYVSKKVSMRAAQVAARRAEKAGFCKVQRFEQLYLVSMLAYGSANVVKRTTSEQDSMHGLKIAPAFCSFSGVGGSIEPARLAVHRAHKVKFSVAYAGEQPLDGAVRVRPFGRYRQALQAVFRVSPRVTVVAFRKRLNVWVHRPRGRLTVEQLVEARGEGLAVLREFAAGRRLELSGDLSQVMLSHHVVEPPVVNEALKPAFALAGPEIKERIGSHVCQTSHPGQIEHEGVARPDGVVKGSDVALGLEWVLLTLPGEWAELKQAVALVEAENRTTAAQVTLLAKAIAGKHGG